MPRRSLPMSATTTLEELQQQNSALRSRLDGAEQTIRAIQQGAVDAFVLEELGRHRVYTLEGTEHPYRLFVERMQQGVATLYADGSILYCNRRLADLLDVPHGELVGASLRDFVAPDDRRAYDDAFVAGQTRSGRCEVTLLRKEGETLPAYTTFNVLPSEACALIGVFVTDLTTQKQHEQLAAAQEALRDADRRKDEFLAMLAHELRGPLAPLGNMLEIMKRAGENREVIQQARGTMERQLAQLVRLVDDLLDVSRITRNRLELRREPVELTAVLKRVIESARAWTAGVEHQIEVTVPPEPIWLDADPARLTQIFHNLFNNACKYTEPTGRIWVRVERPESERQPPDVVVRFKDTGLGIPPDRLSSIFEAFMQVDRSLERAQGGLGIGLTLVKRLVEMHGGIVTAHSEGPGHGSEFVLRLPVADAPAEVSAERASPAVDYLPRERRFLVVDDNADSTASLAMLLSIEGHDTRTARDGME